MHQQAGSGGTFHEEPRRINTGETTNHSLAHWEQKPCIIIFHSCCQVWSHVWLWDCSEPIVDSQHADKHQWEMSNISTLIIQDRGKRSKDHKALHWKLAPTPQRLHIIAKSSYRSGPNRVCRKTSSQKTFLWDTVSVVKRPLGLGSKTTWLDFRFIRTAKCYCLLLRIRGMSLCRRYSKDGGEWIGFKRCIA